MLDDLPAGYLACGAAGAPRNEEAEAVSAGRYPAANGGRVHVAVKRAVSQRVPNAFKDRVVRVVDHGVDPAETGDAEILPMDLVELGHIVHLTRPASRQVVPGADRGGA